MNTRLQKLISIATIGALAISSLYLGSVATYAAALTGVSDTLTSYVVNTASNHTIVFTTPTGIANGETITIEFPTDFDLTSLIEDDFDISSDAPTDFTTAPDCSGTEEVSIAVSGQIITFTFCSGDGGLVAPGGEVTILIGDHAVDSGTGSNQIINATVAGSYIVEIAGTMADSGTFTIPLLLEDQVSVSGTVDASITFAIRTAADDGYTSTCALGTLSTGSVSTCAYRLAVSTNATNGFTTKITSDGDLRTTGGDTIDAIAENGTVTAGVESYGIAVTGATTGKAPSGGVDEEGDFNDDDTPIPTSPTNIITADAPFEYTVSTLTSSTLITHRAAISALTPAGVYNQIVTYTVTGSF